MIAERSTLLNALLPSATNKTGQAAVTLESLLQLFWHYLMKVVNGEVCLCFVTAFGKWHFKNVNQLTVGIGS